MAARKKTVRCGIVGYGGAFDMGKHHGTDINAAGGLQTTAVCDLDARRLKAARADFPGIETFTSLGDMLDAVDLAVIVTPHNTHAPLALKCLNAGKHVVLEKPFCITLKQANAMIDAAEKRSLTLTCYHNRRHDGDFLAIMDIIRQGLIGEVFHVEAFMGGYRKPGKWWRSQKEISGGAFYDWGAHIVDWLLHICPYGVQSVSGYYHKLVWKGATNEDQVEAKVRFGNGASAGVQISSIAAAGKPRWRILGTKGAITDGPDGHFKVVTQVKGRSAEITWPFQPSGWNKYYTNLADHLVRGKPLEVTPESARRVIMVLDLAGQSARKGRELPAPLP